MIGLKQVADRIARACRLNPEIIGLLCAVLPESVSTATALRESNASLRAGNNHNANH